MYRAAMFIVEAAMINPTIPIDNDITMCQNRSPIISEWLQAYLKKFPSVSKN